MLNTVLQGVTACVFYNGFAVFELYFPLMLFSRSTNIIENMFHLSALQALGKSNHQKPIVSLKVIT